MTPSGQHPITATRALDPAGRQPGLDADSIDLYRHHRCLQHYSAARRRPAKTRAGCRAPVSSSSH